MTGVEQVRSATDRSVALRWVLLVASAASLGWLLAPPLPDGAALVQARRDAWEAELVPRRPDGTAMAVKLMASSLWGEVAQAKPVEEPPTVEPRWRIAAVVAQGSDRMVLVAFDDDSQPVMRLRVGDKLPTGHRITKIDGREVCVQSGKKSYRLGIERIEN